MSNKFFIKTTDSHFETRYLMVEGSIVEPIQFKSHGLGNIKNTIHEFDRWSIATYHGKGRYIHPTKERENATYFKWNSDYLQVVDGNYSDYYVTFDKDYKLYVIHPMFAFSWNIAKWDITIDGNLKSKSEGYYLCHTNEEYIVKDICTDNNMNAPKSIKVSQQNCSVIEQKKHI